MLMNAIRRLLGKIAIPSLDTADAIKHFKNNAWKSKKTARCYNDVVEHRFFDNITADLFIENINSNSYVLDVGAGTGRLSLLLEEHGCRVMSCDISAEMLKFIDNNKGARNITTLEASARNIPLESGIFDAVVSMDLMVHFPDWEALLKEQSRLCKKGGLIMFNFFNRENTVFLRERRTGENTTSFVSKDYSPFADENQIHEAANRLGLKVEALYPYNFFTANAMFGFKLPKSQVEMFTAEFDEAIKDDKVLRFVKSFEEKIVRHLPISGSATMIVKLRKLQ